MTQLPFQPGPGLFTDTTPFSAKGAWIEGNNVRFYNGRWEVIGGQAQRGSLSVSGTPNAILEWLSLNGTDYIAWGTTTKLMIELAGVLYDVTPSLSVATPRWAFDNYGETLIANESGGKIWQWSLNTASVAAVVTNAPVKTTCILVNNERQLMAFGCNEESSGTFNGRCIRFSDIEDITSWTSLPTNNAGEIVLDGATSAIVTARKIGPYIGVWTSTELFIGTYVGDPSQTWRFDRVGSNCGAVSLRSATVAGSTAYWLTPDLKFMAWAPGSEPADIACPIIENMRGNFPTTSITLDTFSAYVPKFNEVWFTYSNSGSYIGRYVAFSLTDGKWFKGRMQRRAMHAGLTALLGATTTGALVNCESGMRGAGMTSAANSGLAWNINCSPIFLDSGQRRMMIRSMKVDFQSQTGNLAMSINTGDYLNSTNFSGTPIAIGPTDAKKDFRQSGRLVLINFSGDDGGNVSDTFARQGQPVFDLVAMGER